MQEINKDFKIDDKSFESPAEILDYVKENYPDHHAFLSAWFDDKIEVPFHITDRPLREFEYHPYKRTLISVAKRNIEFFKLSSGIRVYSNLSATYPGSKMLWVKAMVGGWNLSFITPENFYNNRENIHSDLVVTNYKVFRAFKFVKTKIIIECIDFEKIPLGDLYDFSTYSDVYFALVYKKYYDYFAVHSPTDEDDYFFSEKEKCYKIFTCLPSIGIRSKPGKAEICDPYLSEKPISKKMKVFPLYNKPNKFEINICEALDDFRLF